MKPTAPTPAVAKRRLLRLADFLEKLPKERFDFSTFVGEDWEGAQNLSCGTTACGMGWAVTLFGKDCGVHLRRDRWSKTSIYPALINMQGHDMDDSVDLAGKRMFGLEKRELEVLFIPRWSFGPRGQLPGNASAKTLAKHIRRFVAKKYGKAA